jgi:hypothetical protein
MTDEVDELAPKRGILPRILSTGNTFLDKTAPRQVSFIEIL